MERKQDIKIGLLIAAAMACGFAWFDLAGHGAPFVLQNESLAAQHLDGHTLYLFGMLAVVVAEALWPKRFESYPLAFYLLSLGLGIGSTALLASEVPLWAIAIAVVLTGFADVLFLNTTAAHLLCRITGRKWQVAIIVIALTAKTLLTYFFDLFLQPTTQMMLLVVVPGLGVSCALGAYVLQIQSKAAFAQNRVKLQKPFSTVMLCMLIFAAIVFATTRAVSSFGFWSGGYGLESWTPVGNLLMAVGFFVLCYFTLIHTSSRLLLRFLPALFCLFVGYAFLYAGLGDNFGLSEAFLGSASSYAELYGQAFVWAVILLAMRTLPMAPTRILGIGFTCFTIMELALQMALSSVGGAAPFIVLFTFLGAFGLLIWAQCRLYGKDEGLTDEMREERLVDTSAVTNPDSSDPASPVPGRVVLAQSHGLSQRETDVFLLLAQGRSRKFICEELFIADGTASSYIGRVYEKLGVHSKQELLTLVINAEKENEPERRPSSHEG